MKVAKLTMLLVAAGSLSCTAQTDDNRGNSTAASTIAPTIKLGGANGLVISHKDGDDNSLAQVRIQPGSLATGQTVTVSSSFHTEATDVAEEFGIGTGLKPTNVATVVSSNIDLNLPEPMTIALDIPSTAFGLTVGSKHYIVVYTVRDAVSKVWRRGVIPPHALAVQNGKITFTTKLFGRFEVFEAEQKVDVSQPARIVSTPDFINKPVQITRVKPLVAHTDQVVTLHGKYLSGDVSLAVAGYKVRPLPATKKGTMQFRMPDLPFGLKTIRVASGANEATAKVLSRALKLDKPILTLTEDKVCEGLAYYDMNGEAKEGRKDCSQPAACSTDGEVGCVTTVQFKAVDVTKLIPANIRIGVPIAGTVGAFPSAQHPLPGAVGSVADLTEATFHARVKSSQSFEYFTSSGVRQQGAGDPDIREDHIREGVTVFGTQGRLSSPTGGALAAEDLRHGVTYAGVTGALKTRCRNGANQVKVNYAADPGKAGLDPLDNLTDNGLPTQYPLGGGEHVCDASNWVDRSSETGQPGNHSCKGNGNGKECLFEDKTTKSYWYIKTGVEAKNFAEAVEACKDISHKGGDWRLPSQKELMTAYVNGMATLAQKGNKLISTNGYYWTTTNDAGSKTGQKKLSFALADGQAKMGTTSSSALKWLCIKN